MAQATMKMDYTKTTDKPFDRVVADIERLAAEKSFRVLHIHNVQQTLQEKGFIREPIKIVEICNAGFAHKALGKEIGVSMFMPCKITVYTEGGQTHMIAPRPAVIAEFFPEAGLEELAADVDTVITTIVDEAAKG
jgi:uncharacterized protein (DUF302 family)